MFKYVWIIILVLVSVFGWVCSIYDIVLTIRDKRDKEDNDNIFDIFDNLEDFTQYWIIFYPIAVFMVSFILYMIAKLEGA